MADEENFVQRFLDAGFVEIHNKNFKPRDNWYGVSTYAPDGVFVRGNKWLVMSIQGVWCSPTIDEWDVYTKYEALWRTRSIRLVTMYEFEPRRVVYKDWTGNLPPKELVSEFLLDGTAASGASSATSASPRPNPHPSL